MRANPRRFGCTFALGILPALLSAQPNADPLRQGAQLDLAGKYGEARQLFAKAIEAATTPEAKGRALRSMAMSYAFESDCKGAEKYESQVYDMFVAAKEFFDAGETANELARVCIEAGNLDDALDWYRKGHDAGLREAGLTADRKDLWDFRWAHAQARIAVRRGNKAEAQKHIVAAKSILDKGTNPDQAQFFPYLTGYAAFYAGDYKSALADFQKAGQNDPFILVMIGQTYEKLGDKTQAMDYYRKASGFNGHNPPNAFAHPFAKKKLAGT